MYKRLLPIIIFLLSCCQFSDAQVLVSKTLERSWSTQQIDSFYTQQGLPAAILPNSYGVDIYRIIYNTVSYDETTPTVASGLMIIPREKECASALLSYQHGTVLKRADAPSYLQGEYVIGVAMGADGYVGVMPDYLGLGESGGIHPYVHARSEATAVADLIRAVREACNDIEHELNGQVFLTGYSQGGHATMAAHQYMYENFPTEFNVVASVPMSGPYSLSEVMKELILSDVPYSNPGYLPMVIQTYRTVYNLYPNISSAILAPYDSLLPIWTSGDYSSGYVDNQMNMMGVNPPKQIVIPAVLDTFSNDSNHVLRVRLRENDVYRWVPQVPVKFLYCKSDEQVDYQNSIKAYNYMVGAGATQISINDVDSTLGHFECAQFALLEMRAFFEPMRHDKITINVDQYIFASGPGVADGEISIAITGGEAPYTVNWSAGGSGTTSPGLAPGTHTVTVTGNDGCTKTAEFSMNFNAGLDETELSSQGLYPNPAGEKIFLKQAHETYSILDIYGRVVIQGNDYQTGQFIDISTLAPGTYFFRAGSYKTTFIKK